MSTKPLMLEGIIKEENSDEGLLHKMRREQQRLEEEILSLRRELDDTNREKDRVERTIRNLQVQLSPLHRALRAVFGEIELAVGEEEISTVNSPTPNSPSSSVDPRWQSYKDSMPGAPSRIIDALLAHRDGLNIAQLSKLLRMDYNTAKNAVSRLRSVGAVTQDGKGSPVRLSA